MKILSILRFFLIAIPVFIIVYISAIGAMAIKEFIKKYIDYLAMYKEQLYERQIFKYPPFFKLIKITLKHKDFEKVKESSMWLYQVLNQQLNMPVLGPEEPVISKIRKRATSCC